jgi:polysaccharide pyruvyl transferase WcaK-like protein
VIAVIHAYSRRNAGDGLLVDLTLEHLSRAGVSQEECELFALDAASFSDQPRVHQAGVSGRGLSLQMLAAGAQLGAVGAAVASRGHLRLGDLCTSLHDADAIVGLAGGYLRTPDIVTSLGTLLNHIPQLVMASRTNVPSMYMPQSIGPLRGPVGSLVRRLLGNIDLLCVRDDVSRRDLQGHGALVRYPDLAVMLLAERLESIDVSAGPRDAPVILVGRDLGSGDGYHKRLRALAELVRPATWAVQAEGRGQKNDQVFYEQLGIRETGRLVDVLGSFPHSVVVSVRLHGAIQALLAGSPAVHLSYQRKGWSAFADLGLGDFVHDARKFDPESVARQVQMLRRGPEEFWERVRDNRRRLLNASEALTNDVVRVLRSG